MLDADEVDFSRRSSDSLWYCVYDPRLAEITAGGIKCLSDLDDLFESKDVFAVVVIVVSEGVDASGGGGAGGGANGGTSTESIGIGGGGSLGGEGKENSLYSPSNDT